MSGAAFAQLPDPSPLPWYEGGALQKASAKEWVKAAPENRLATMGDFTASLNAISDLSKIDQARLAKLRGQAEALLACVNDMAGRGDAPDQPVAELVVICALMKRN